LAGFDHADLIKRLVKDNCLDLVMLLEHFLKTLEHSYFGLAGEFEAENSIELLFILTLNFIHGKPEFFSL
jgi:hypothetical protein